MKLLFDLFPVILFFLVFKKFGIFPATATAIVASLLQISWTWGRHRKVDPMLWISASVITVFGGATLLLHNKTYIQWKPTVLYWIFAVLLLGADLIFRKNLLKSMLGEKLKLDDDRLWRRLNFAWGVFFLLLGGLNLFVAHHFSMNAWVNFKLFGTTGLMFLFLLAQMPFLAPHLKDDAPPPPPA